MSGAQQRSCTAPATGHMGHPGSTAKARAPRHATHLHVPRRHDACHVAQDLVIQVPRAPPAAHPLQGAQLCQLRIRQVAALLAGLQLPPVVVLARQGRLACVAQGCRWAGGGRPWEGEGSGRHTGHSAGRMGHDSLCTEMPWPPPLPRLLGAASVLRYLFSREPSASTREGPGARACTPAGQGTRPDSAETARRTWHEVGCMAGHGWRGRRARGLEGRDTGPGSSGDREQCSREQLL